MPVRGGFRGGFRSGFRGRGGPIRGRGVPPQINYSGNTFSETVFEQMNIATNSSRSLSDMDFTTDDFPVQMTGPNTYEPWGNTTGRKRMKSMDYDAPSKKHRSHGPTPPPFASLPPRPFPPRPMGPFGLPPRPPGPPMPDMGPPFARRFMGPGPGFSGPLPPHLGPRGPARFPPPPFGRPGPPMRPVGFRPPVPPRGFPNGMRAPPGGLPRRGTFGGPPRMFKH